MHMYVCVTSSIAMCKVLPPPPCTFLSASFTFYCAGNSYSFFVDIFNKTCNFLIIYNIMPLDNFRSVSKMLISVCCLSLCVAPVGFSFLFTRANIKTCVKVDINCLQHPGSWFPRPKNRCSKCRYLHLIIWNNLIVSEKRQYRNCMFTLLSNKDVMSYELTRPCPGL